MTLFTSTSLRTSLRTLSLYSSAQVEFRECLRRFCTTYGCRGFLECLEQYAAAGNWAQNDAAGWWSHRGLEKSAVAEADENSEMDIVTVEILDRQSP